MRGAWCAVLGIACVGQCYSVRGAAAHRGAHIVRRSATRANRRCRSPATRASRSSRRLRSPSETIDESSAAQRTPDVSQPGQIFDIKKRGGLRVWGTAFEIAFAGALRAVWPPTDYGIRWRRHAQTATERTVMRTVHVPITAGCPTVQPILYQLQPP